ncbi:MAG TPA: discoidin domain-containing protein [Pyrinomonadaceae bacterium]|jgi:hypothetical protein|nr:discoidin domain-containing protein [Pyrinomonadaceae bacterium]
MKRCPTCRSTYTDDSLRFCLQDGSQLVHISDEEGSPNAERTSRDHLRGWPDEREAPPTEVFDARIVAPTARTRTSVPTEVIHSRATEVAEHKAERAHTTSSTALKAALIFVAALFVAGIGLGLTLWLRSSPASSPNNQNAVTREGSSSDAANVNGNTAPAKSESQSASTVKSIRATASSTRPALAGNTYEPGNALDGRLMTAWVEGVDGTGIGEWIRCDFGREVTLNRISIAPGYFKSPQIWARNNRLAAATIFFSDGTSRPFRFPDRMEEQILEVGAVKTSWVRIVIDEVYDGTDPDTAISQLAFE